MSTTIDRSRIERQWQGDFGPEAYADFLKWKALPEYSLTHDGEANSYTMSCPKRYASRLGMSAQATDGLTANVPEFLYDDQHYLVERAFDAKRFAVWSGCGNGKTLIGLEWARQVVAATAGRVMIVTLNQIVPEWLDEAKRWYGEDLPIVRLNSRAEMRAWCEGEEPGIAITNYEKFNPDPVEGQVVNECRRLAGVVLDESSRLKTGGGKQKWAIVKSFKGVEYKLSLTATPAPNDVMEFASQASFLEKLRSEGEILWTYFSRDPKTLEWTVKPHARNAFYDFMSSWSIYVNNPKRYGWRLNVPDVPAFETHVVEVPATDEQLAILARLTADEVTGAQSLFPEAKPLGMVQRLKASQAAKGFLYATDGIKKTVEHVPSRKPSVVADLIVEQAKHGKVLVWTEFDAETRLISTLLANEPGVVTLTGSTPKDERAAALERFRTGDGRILLTRAKLIGFGVNLQCVRSMIFSGWSDSFESLYQAIRRAIRHGQMHAVKVFFPMVRELEGEVYDNVMRKQNEFEKSISEMEDRYIATL